MKEVLNLIRVKHYIKNIYVWLAIIFSGRLLEINSLISVFFAFLAFSLTSSAVYIINDIKDKEKDKLHEKKKNRPIASGAISIKRAKLIASTCLILALIFNCFSTNNNYSYLYLGGYLILNLAYTFKLKEIPLLDITIIVIGFMIRMMYGAFVINVEISNWLYLTLISVSFFQALGKRRNEMSYKEEGQTRAVLKNYTKEFLDKNMYICIALSIVFYSLWCVDPITTATHDSELIIWSIPIVMLICMKYSMILEGSSDGDPVDVILSDKLLIALIAFLGLFMLFILYG